MIRFVSESSEPRGKNLIKNIDYLFKLSFWLLIDIRMTTSYFWNVILNE